MTNTPLYTPVIRWKRGEQLALSLLSPEVRADVRPLIELLSHGDQSGGSIHEADAAFGSRVAGSLVGTEGLLDAHLMHSDSLAERRACRLAARLCAAEDAGAKCTPVLEVMQSDAEAKSFRRSNGTQRSRVGVRLNLVDLRAKRTTSSIHAILDAVGATPEGSIALVDCQEHHDTDPAASEVVQVLPCLREFGEIVMLSGAFPTHEHFSGARMYRPKRTDLHRWLNGGEGSRDVVSQHGIGFGDYTMQYPIYRPPPEMCTPTLTARFACESDWCVLRGYPATIKGSEQWIGHAIMLRDLGVCHLGCCAGCDRVIALAELQSGPPGGFTEWVAYGVTHHISLTARQIARASAVAIRTPGFLARV